MPSDRDEQSDQPTGRPPLSPEDLRDRQFRIYLSRREVDRVEPAIRRLKRRHPVHVTRPLAAWIRVALLAWAEDMMREE